MPAMVSQPSSSKARTAAPNTRTTITKLLTTLSWDVLNEVRRAYPDKLYQTLIPRNVRVSEASSHGQPVTVYDPACRGSQAFRQLAEEVMNQ